MLFADSLPHNETIYSLRDMFSEQQFERYDLKRFLNGSCYNIVQLSRQSAWLLMSFARCHCQPVCTFNHSKAHRKRPPKTSIECLTASSRSVFYMARITHSNHICVVCAVACCIICLTVMFSAITNVTIDGHSWGWVIAAALIWHHFGDDIMAKN